MYSLRVILSRFSTIKLYAHALSSAVQSLHFTNYPLPEAAEVLYAVVPKLLTIL